MGGERSTLLLVEDDPDVRDTLAAHLRDLGHDVVPLANGKAALELLRSGTTPDLIILDLMMPVMDGWQFRVEQKRDPRLARIPVLAMSANPSAHAAAIDAHAFLRKPFDIPALESSIRAVLGAVSHGRAQERRLAELERALEQRRAAEEWSATFDAVASPILVLRDGAVVRSNRAADELPGPRPDAEPWPAILALAARAGEGVASGFARDARGERAWELVARRCVLGGEPHVVVSGIEVTERMRLETLSTLGAAIAGVAHEVRNPLFGISATLDALQARCGEDSDVRRYLPALHEEIARLKRLMQDLLDYGRPSQLDLRRATLADAVAGALRSCAALAEERRVRLVDRTSWAPLVRIDRQRMLQVLHNLVENAVQHSAPGAEVVLSAAAVEEGGRRFLEQRVEDRGPGFAEEDLRRVFQPFFTRRRGGTGLGLAIASRIVHEHGGSVRAENRPDGGAVLTIRLPVVEP